ncbi:uncharacterized protein LOC111805522 [Cucurbita pepo subsp. pepo]|uniref:uncharacterized protein LOC111805522 n=1 Tax=Cucurbita pepo subsp. pepo TaxID=3664 RepID=UPI000C9D6F7F|nr:uncharacterized protein LOC111805522 [Cucurbita pepo subsp. pepo]
MTNEETSANRLSSSLIGDLPALDKIRQEFCLLLVTMTPSTVTSSTILDLFSTDNETFLALWRIRSGGSFPANVHDINPYQCKPENLPGTFFTRIHVVNFPSFPANVHDMMMFFKAQAS